MTGRSHLLIGGFAVLCAMRWHVLSPEPLSVCTGLLGSLLPDIDTERSMLGSRVKILSRFLAKAFGHRGLTHSGLMLLVAAAVMNGLMGPESLRGPWGALLLGAATHIAADLPTGGCQVFAPSAVRDFRSGLMSGLAASGKSCFLCPSSAFWAGQDFPVMALFRAMSLHLRITRGCADMF